MIGKFLKKIFIKLDLSKVQIFALRDIKKGEELSYDYGFGYDKDYKQFVCKCGAKNCVGYIVREGSRWRIKKSRSVSASR